MAASYARFSSDLQDVSSIAQQQRKCHDKAAENGHTIPPELEFADEAVSGTKRDRDGLNAMLAAARDGRFGTLYFESLSRLARVRHHHADAQGAGLRPPRSCHQRHGGH